MDYEETFSPVVKPVSRTILSLACSRNWFLNQMDVKNALNHGTLKEKVLMKQPEGFEDKKYPSLRVEKRIPYLVWAEAGSSSLVR